MIVRLLLAVLLLTAASPSAMAKEERAVVEQFTLDNGMEVIVIPNHRVPAVSHMLWFRFGSADDPLSKSGLTHFHEHMMFQGTTTRAKGEYADIIAEHGGQQNAFTGADVTAYYANIDRAHLPLVMELEADRLQNLSPTEEDMAKERDVIIEERRERVENNPEAMLGEQMDAVMFYHHPYGTPLIGWKHEMENLTLEDVMDLHHEYYHPRNAILVVSGAITAAELKPLAEKYYGSLPIGKETVREWVQEPPHRVERIVKMSHVNQKTTRWIRAYMAPSIAWGETKHAMPLFVLEHLLGGGKTSRLYQRLVVKEKLAAGVSANYWGMNLGPSKFTVYVTASEGADLKKIEKIVEEELKRVMNEDASDEELNRAKTLQKAATIYAREGLQSMGYIIGWLRTIGMPLETFHQWPELIGAVSKEDLREAAKFIFKPEESVTGILTPEKKKEKPDA